MLSIVWYMTGCVVVLVVCAVIILTTWRSEGMEKSEYISSAILMIVLFLLMVLFLIKLYQLVGYKVLQ